MTLGCYSISLLLWYQCISLSKTVPNFCQSDEFSNQNHPCGYMSTLITLGTSFFELVHWDWIDHGKRGWLWKGEGFLPHKIISFSSLHLIAYHSIYLCRVNCNSPYHLCYLNEILRLSHHYLSCSTVGMYKFMLWDFVCNIFGHNLIRWGCDVWPSNL